MRLGNMTPICTLRFGHGCMVSCIEPIRERRTRLAVIFGIRIWFIAWAHQDATQSIVSGRALHFKKGFRFESRERDSTYELREPLQGDVNMNLEKEVGDMLVGGSKRAYARICAHGGQLEWPLFELSGQFFAPR